MRRLWVALATLALLVAFMPATVMAAAPTNDNFAAAIELTGDRGSVSGTTTDATIETGEPTAGLRAHSVWYQWSPDTGGIATFSTCGASWDSYITVFTVVSGPPSFVGSVVGSNDDCYNWGGDLGSSAGFVAEVGVTYWIQLAGYSSTSSGPFTLKWSVKAASDSGALTVVIKNLGSDPTYCLVTLKGSNLDPNEWISLDNASGGSVGFSPPGGTRWTYSEEMNRSTWNRDAADLSWGYAVLSSDGTTTVTPKVANRCTAP